MNGTLESWHSLGVVLAGGESSRMGRDKALLAWQGRPLIERQLAVLRAAGVDEVSVSGERASYGGIADARPRAGPLGGLAGIADKISDLEVDLLVIPVDMPLLGAALLRRLRSARPEARCLRFAGQVLPLRLRLDSACHAVLAELLSAAEPAGRSLRALAQRLNVIELEFDADEAEQFTDCNTVTQWQEVCE